MNNPQLNSFTMFSVVLQFGKKFSAIIASIPALASLFDLFGQIVDEIGDKSEEVKEGTKGKTRAKRLAERDVAVTVAGLAGCLHAYATSKKDADLAEKSKVTVWDIENARDAERGKMAKRYVKLVEEHKAELKDWNVTDEKIAAAYKKITEHDEAIGIRNSARTGRKSGVGSLEKLFEEANDLLKEQIDPVVASMAGDHADFVSEYDAARVIRDVAAGRGDGKQPTPAPSTTTPAS